MIPLEELYDLIKTRRSVRKFQDKPVPEALLVKALEISAWAPNGGNYQPWRFLIVTNKDLIRRMADAVKAKTELMSSWPEAANFGEVVERWKRTSD
ncbi:MAG TPA: nitroreductase family protein, partial [Thermodesulfobacteriota bacterium]|nr:nitroreductase family protein [Thermodesulfobacteriota bacterium]